LNGGDRRWFRRSTGEKRPVTRDNNNNNNNNIIIIIIIIMIKLFICTKIQQANDQLHREHRYLHRGKRQTKSKQQSTMTRITKREIKHLI
jgi:hypothetical protein